MASPRHLPSANRSSALSTTSRAAMVTYLESMPIVNATSARCKHPNVCGGAARQAVSPTVGWRYQITSTRRGSPCSLSPSRSP